MRRLRQFHSQIRVIPLSIMQFQSELSIVAVFIRRSTVTSFAFLRTSTESPLRSTIR